MGTVSSEGQVSTGVVIGRLLLLLRGYGGARRGRHSFAPV